MTALLSLEFVPAREVVGRPSAWWDSVLGGVMYGARDAAGLPDKVPRLAVDAPRLDADGAVCEVWRAAAPLREGVAGPIRYRCNDRLLFGCIELDEGASVDGRAESALQGATEAAYRALFALLDECGYPGLLRVWNYFPGITANSGGGERYWQFNTARQDAFLACGRGVGGNVPAACALGAASGPLSIAFLALRELPLAIENPRQTAAYHYPAQYGPRSPTFARASVSGGAGAPLLFVSGTASIVGHRSLHAGDALAQTEESFRNIEAVLGEARRVVPGRTPSLDALAYKVYLRAPADLAVVEACVRRHVGALAPVVFLRADVCRADLLVEIEACGGAIELGGR